MANLNQHLAGFDAALALNYDIGDISASGRTISVEVGEGIAATLTSTGTNVRLSVSANPVITVDMRRNSIYGATALEGQVWDRELIGQNQLVVDDTIYTSSNDGGFLWIATDAHWYVVNYFISNGGVNARICSRRLI